MSYGIPEFKMEQQVVARRAALLTEAGVVFYGGQVLGDNLALADLQARHDAVVLAYGAYRPRRLDLPGEDLAWRDPSDGLPCFLQSGIDRRNGGAQDRCGGQVGRGDRRRRHRDGLRPHRRPPGRRRRHLPLSPRPRQYARIDTRGGPRRGGGRRVRVAEPARGALQTCRSRWSPQCPRGWVSTAPFARSGPVARAWARPIPGDASGRSRCRALNFEVAADLVINALGFIVEDAGPLTGGAVDMSPQGRVAADRETRMTAAPGVFVAGDARLGPSLAVWAIREGREVAAAVDRYLGTLSGSPSGASRTR